MNKDEGTPMRRALVKKIIKYYENLERSRSRSNPRSPMPSQSIIKSSVMSRSKRESDQIQKSECFSEEKMRKKRLLELKDLMRTELEKANNSGTLEFSPNKYIESKKGYPSFIQSRLQSQMNFSDQDTEMCRTALREVLEEKVREAEIIEDSYCYSVESEEPGPLKNSSLISLSLQKTILINNKAEKEAFEYDQRKAKEIRRMQYASITREESANKSCPKKERRTPAKRKKQRISKKGTNLFESEFYQPEDIEALKILFPLKMDKEQKLNKLLEFKRLIDEALLEYNIGVKPAGPNNDYVQLFDDEGFGIDLKEDENDCNFIFTKLKPLQTAMRDEETDTLLVKEEDTVKIEIPAKEEKQSKEIIGIVKKPASDTRDYDFIVEALEPKLYYIKVQVEDRAESVKEEITIPNPEQIQQTVTVQLFTSHDPNHIDSEFPENEDLVPIIEKEEVNENEIAAEDKEEKEEEEEEKPIEAVEVIEHIEEVHIQEESEQHEDSQILDHEQAQSNHESSQIRKESQHQEHEVPVVEEHPISEHISQHVHVGSAHEHEETNGVKEGVQDHPDDEKESLPDVNNINKNHIDAAESCKDHEEKEVKVYASKSVTDMGRLSFQENHVRVQEYVPAQSNVAVNGSSIHDDSRRMSDIDEMEEKDASHIAVNEDHHSQENAELHKLVEKKRHSIIPRPKSDVSSIHESEEFDNESILKHQQKKPHELMSDGSHDEREASEGKMHTSERKEESKKQSSKSSVKESRKSNSKHWRASLQESLKSSTSPVKNIVEINCEVYDPEGEFLSLGYLAIPSETDYLDGYEVRRSNKYEKVQAKVDNGELCIKRATDFAPIKHRIKKIDFFKLPNTSCEFVAMKINSHDSAGEKEDIIVYFIDQPIQQKAKNDYLNKTAKLHCPGLEDKDGVECTIVDVREERNMVLVAFKPENEGDRDEYVVKFSEEEQIPEHDIDDYINKIIGQKSPVKKPNSTKGNQTSTRTIDVAEPKQSSKKKRKTPLLDSIKFSIRDSAGKKINVVVEQDPVSEESRGVPTPKPAVNKIEKKKDEQVKKADIPKIQRSETPNKKSQKKKEKAIPKSKPVEIRNFETLYTPTKQTTVHKRLFDEENPEKTVEPGQFGRVSLQLDGNQDQTYNFNGFGHVTITKKQVESPVKPKTSNNTAPGSQAKKQRSEVNNAILQLREMEYRVRINAKIY